MTESTKINQFNTDTQDIPEVLLPDEYAETGAPYKTHVYNWVLTNGQASCVVCNHTCDAELGGFWDDMTCCNPCPQ